MILDYAVYNAAEVGSSPKKLVEAFLDKDGKPTTEANSSFKVTAEMPRGEDNRTLTRTALQSEIARLLIENKELSLSRVNLRSDAALEATIGLKAKKLLNALDVLEELNATSKEATREPTSRPTRLPTPSLLELEEQLQNVGPR